MRGTSAGYFFGLLYSSFYSRRETCNLFICIFLMHAHTNARAFVLVIFIYSTSSYASLSHLCFHHLTCVHHTQSYIAILKKLFDSFFFISYFVSLTILFFDFYRQTTSCNFYDFYFFLCNFFIDLMF